MFLDWPDDDRTWALALHALERDTCPQCRQPLSESLDPEAEGRYTAEEVGMCHACEVLRAKSKDSDPHVHYRARKLTGEEIARRG